MKNLLQKNSIRIISSIVIILLIGGAGWILYKHWSKPPIPSSILSQINYPVFLPQTGITLNQRSYKFDASQKLLTFTGYVKNGELATFAEQATPEPITDLSGYYQQFLQTLNEYQSFDSLQGTVYLTHPTGAGQAAVMSSKGTLMFIRVANDVSQNTWQPIFNNLQIVYKG
jgi:hypothetical protein